MTTWPGSAFLKHSKFVEIVKEVKDMGFDPFRSMFVQAIRVLIGMKKANWENKLEVYGRWGWSKDETLLAFKKRPLIMITSESKITKVMDYLINKMGYPSSDIARIPLIVCFILEERIIPRCSVVQIFSVEGSNQEGFTRIYFFRTCRQVLLGEICDQISRKLSPTAECLPKEWWIVRTNYQGITSENICG
jgi:hypothetical protein